MPAIRLQKFTSPDKSVKWRGHGLWTWNVTVMQEEIRSPVCCLFIRLPPCVCTYWEGRRWTLRCKRNRGGRCRRVQYGRSWRFMELPQRGPVASCMVPWLTLTFRRAGGGVWCASEKKRRKKGGVGGRGFKVHFPIKSRLQLCSPPLSPGVAG